MKFTLIITKCRLNKLLTKLIKSISWLLIRLQQRDKDFWIAQCLYFSKMYIYIYIGNRLHAGKFRNVEKPWQQHYDIFCFVTIVCNTLYKMHLYRSLQKHLPSKFLYRAILTAQEKLEGCEGQQSRPVQTDVGTEHKNGGHCYCKPYCCPCLDNSHPFCN